ncbi:Fic family protein [Rheinheimera soli]|uniref:Fic family protein n=1 Tax=Rheinheimera soli TaxID=443616 RepID=UPI001E427D71|nr:Fic family protein [Rheinheimera soli]
MWIWQQSDWPAFRYDQDQLNPLLREVHFLQGLLLGRIGGQGESQCQQATLDTLLANILNSSAIEGEQLNHSSVRSSLARKLGLHEAEPAATSAKTDGLANMLMDAIMDENALQDKPLTEARLLQWHAWLFPPGASLLKSIAGGSWRGEETMQVVSGRLDKPKVHFEAPPKAILDQELTAFINWFNTSRQDSALDPLLRAAITHLWFITLHPLEDGNGRIARLLTDLALAQAEAQSIRFYAMSVAILQRRRSYYDILEQTQRGDLDITPWLLWFFDALKSAIEQVLQDIEQNLAKTRFWQNADHSRLNKEQIKVLNRLLDGDFADGISGSQYEKVAKVSRATATRHLVQLVEQGCLVRTEAGGRSTRYKIAD